jgi:hypothetical protein
LVPFAPECRFCASILLVERLVADDPEARDLLGQAIKETQPHGGARRKGEHKSKIDNIQLAAPTGTSAAAALRRLRKDRPDIHAEVLAGELSPHGGMIEVGFRKRVVYVPDDMAISWLKKR